MNIINNYAGACLMKKLLFVLIWYYLSRHEKFEVKYTKKKSYILLFYRLLGLLQLQENQISMSLFFRRPDLELLLIFHYNLQWNITVINHLWSKKRMKADLWICIIRVGWWISKHNAFLVIWKLLGIESTV